MKHWETQSHKRGLAALTGEMETGKSNYEAAVKGLKARQQIASANEEATDGDLDLD